MDVGGVAGEEHPPDAVAAARCRSSQWKRECHPTSMMPRSRPMEAVRTRLISSSPTGSASGTGCLRSHVIDGTSAVGVAAPVGHQERRTRPVSYRAMSPGPFGPAVSSRSARTTEHSTSRPGNRIPTSRAPCCGPRRRRRRSARARWSGAGSSSPFARAVTVHPSRPGRSGDHLDTPLDSGTMGARRTRPAPGRRWSAGVIIANAYGLGAGRGRGRTSANRLTVGVVRAEGQEVVGQPAGVEQLEGAGHGREGAAGRVGRGPPLRTTDRATGAGEIPRDREPGRAGADDEDVDVLSCGSRSGAVRSTTVEHDARPGLGSCQPSLNRVGRMAARAR